MQGNYLEAIKRYGVSIAKIDSYYGDRSVSIYEVVTKLEERGQGIASVLIVETMKATRQAGQKFMVLHSSPLAENLYKWLGFVAVTQFYLYASEAIYIW